MPRSRLILSTSHASLILIKSVYIEWRKWILLYECFSFDFRTATARRVLSLIANEISFKFDEVLCVRIHRCQLNHAYGRHSATNGVWNRNISPERKVGTIDVRSPFSAKAHQVSQSALIIPTVSSLLAITNPSVIIWATSSTFPLSRHLDPLHQARPLPTSLRSCHVGHTFHAYLFRYDCDVVTHSAA